MRHCLSENTKAILMLTHYFNRSDRNLCKPLTENGFGYLAHWMVANNYQPQDLLDNERLTAFFTDFSDEITHFTSKSALSGFMRGLDKTISEMTEVRFRTLLSRGMALSQALEKWQSAGIWILSRADKGYPTQIKSKMREKAPAVLFGIGNIELLNYKGIGFVGSRHCGPSDEAATIHYVDDINQHGYHVVSGAAKGVDSIAMHRSMSNGNNAIGILGDSLFQACGDNQWRSYLKNNQLLLVSPFDPEASFGRGQNAMLRNKYIYFLSEAVIAVCSGIEGGTFSGVKENLVANWCPQYISRHHSPNLAGNEEILGGFPNSKSKVKVQAQAIAITPEQSLINLMDADQNKAVSQASSNTDPISSKTVSSEPSKSSEQTNTSSTVEPAQQHEMDELTESETDSVANLHPAFLGKETFAAFYYDLFDVFKAKQTNDEDVSLTEAQILEGFSDLVSIIGNAAVKKLLTHFQEHDLLIRQGRSKIYKIKTE
ncbi:DNA-processing protein DprA [Photobacterium leiognathi]|uniref:DNA-processing protein DprA n=1 Tax=Photobacterium leiognathi TaxID=553611 RepID=UPI0015E77B90|nr:DNA-processing protein DprA [Photobacterium leiognathi]